MPPHADKAINVIGGVRFVKNCDRCGDTGCYWCLADHTEECVKHTGGMVDRNYSPPLCIGNCQASPCLYVGRSHEEVLKYLNKPIDAGGAVEF